MEGTVTQLTKHDLVVVLARDIVADVAPQELPMYRAQRAAYLKASRKAPKSPKSRDQVIGFGRDAAAVFLTPAVLALMTVVVDFVVDLVKEAAKDQAKAYVSETVQGVFRKLRPTGVQEPHENLFALTPQQLDKIRELISAQALQLRLSERTARLLADSITGQLVVAPA
jgi:hypothetical protein